VRPHVLQPQGHGLSDELTEHATPTWRRTDVRARGVVQAGRDEPGKAGPRRVEDPDRRVLCPGQVTRGAEDPLQDDLEVQIRQDDASNVEKGVSRAVDHPSVVLIVGRDTRPQEPISWWKAGAVAETPSTPDRYARCERLSICRPKATMRSASTRHARLSWHRDARRFLRRHRAALAGRAVAIFALGPMTEDAKQIAGAQKQLGAALRRAKDLRPESVAVFGGVIDPAKLRFPFNRMPAADVRDWDLIRAWAAEHAGAFSAAAAVT
jgi:hypothetical protein